MDRRRFLQLASLTAAGVVTPSLSHALQNTSNTDERSLGFYNLHTGETLHTVYWAEGQYIQNSLSQINHLLRDHRQNESTAIDTRLLDSLYIVQQQTSAKQNFHIISGYRSPETNALLHNNSNGVAKKSLHMQGKAIDIRLPGVQLSNLHKSALALKAGGVGFYPNSSFVHLDTGRVRQWAG